MSTNGKLTNLFRKSESKQEIIVFTLAIVFETRISNRPPAKIKQFLNSKMICAKIHVKCRKLNSEFTIYIIGFFCVARQMSCTFHVRNREKGKKDADTRCDRCTGYRREGGITKRRKCVNRLLPRNTHMKHESQVLWIVYTISSALSSTKFLFLQKN